MPSNGIPTFLSPFSFFHRVDIVLLYFARCHAVQPPHSHPSTDHNRMFLHRFPNFFIIQRFRVDYAQLPCCPLSKIAASRYSTRRVQTSRYESEGRGVEESMLTIASSSVIFETRSEFPLLFELSNRARVIAVLGVCKIVVIDYHNMQRSLESGSIGHLGRHPAKLISMWLYC